MSLDLSLTAGASASITPTQANSTSATSQLGGCANLGAAVELDLGGEGGILGFIPVQASGPVFMKNFNLFQVRTFGVESLLDVYWSWSAEMLQWLVPVVPRRAPLPCFPCQTSRIDMSARRSRHYYKSGKPDCLSCICPYVCFYKASPFSVITAANIVVVYYLLSYCFF